MTNNPYFIDESWEDSSWLEINLNEIYDDLAVQIVHDNTADYAIEVLLMVMPFVCLRTDLPRWQGVLIKALVQAQVLKDIDSQIQLWSYLGICLFREGKHKSAATAFNQALSQIDQSVTPEISLTARIGMLHGEAIFHTHNIDEFVQETLEVSREVEDEFLLARMHFTLAIAYTHRANTVVALGYAQTAYAYWTKLNLPDDQDRALLMMAETCRVAGLYKLSRFFLDRSLSRYTHRFQSAIANYQEGAIAFMNKDYEESREKQEKALREFQDVRDYPYLTGAAHHAIGLTYTQLQAYPLARRHLRDAMAIWLQLENIFEQANGLYAIGFLDQCLGEFSSAREYYLDALERLATLPDSPMVADLIDNITESLEKLRL